MRKLGPGVGTCSWHRPLGALQLLGIHEEPICSMWHLAVYPNTVYEVEDAEDTCDQFVKEKRPRYR